MVTIVYNKQRVLVTEEVAEFLEQDKRRHEAEKRSDRRHRAYHRVDPDKAVITDREKGVNLVLNQVIRSIQTEELWTAVSLLPSEDRLLIQYRYCDELTMEEIGRIFGISKMAVSKRHKKVLGKLRVMLSASSLLKGLLFCLWQHCRTLIVTLAVPVILPKPVRKNGSIYMDTRKQVVNRTQRFHIICYFSGSGEFTQADLLLC